MRTYGRTQYGVLCDELDRLSLENQRLSVEVGQLKQGMWPMKDKEIERWKGAYENMKDFAIKSGLDVTCYG